MSPSREPDNAVVERFAVPPDPGQASTVDDLVERLRLLKVWADDPSFERITDRINAMWRAAGRPLAELATKSSVVRCFRPGRRRLNADLFVAVVQVLHRDVGYVAQWRQALRVIGGEVGAASQVRVQDSLPPELAGFTGRTPELDRLREIDGGAVVISAIEGMAGVGKTQLAVRAGHMLLRDNAFERVLFVNLRGFHPDQAQPPADPAAVLDGFLRLLGVPGQQIPHDLPSRSKAYRERLNGSRTLVVLDNASDTEQIQPLLPETPGCLTLVTSRRSLADLPSATHLAVDVFTLDEAIAFLTGALCGVSVGSDPHAAARIAERCGHLPLALGLVAGHIRSTPGWTLTDHAGRLDERHRQKRLEGGVELAFSLSYQHLSSDQQRLLRLVSLHPGQDLDAYAAAALTDTDVSTTATMLENLCRDHLLQQATPGRYSFHDLVRAYAGTRSSDEDPPAQRRTALTRLFDYYLSTAAIAMDMAYPNERHRRPTVPPTGGPKPNLANGDRANLWLDTELTNLLAAAHRTATHDWPEHTWQLSVILDRHLHIRGRYSDAQTLHQQGLSAARHLGDQQAEVHALNGLGYAHRILGHHDLAGDHFGQALQIAQIIDDRLGELNALTGLAAVHGLLSRHEDAGDYFRRAAEVAQAVGDRVGELNALTGLGRVHWFLGRFHQAEEHHGRALQIAREIGDRLGELYALTGISAVHWLLGRYEQAGDQFERALKIAQAIGSRVGELQVLNGLGQVYRMLRRYSEAADCYRQALDLADEVGSPNWHFEAVQGLGRLHHATGHPDLALTHHEQALQCATDLAQPDDQARAHDGLAHAYHALNDRDRARQHWQKALEILSGIGNDHTEDVETNVVTIRAHLDGL